MGTDGLCFNSKAECVNQLFRRGLEFLGVAGVQRLQQGGFILILNGQAVKIVLASRPVLASLQSLLALSKRLFPLVLLGLLGRASRSETMRFTSSWVNVRPCPPLSSGVRVVGCSVFVVLISSLIMKPPFYAVSSAKYKKRGMRTVLKLFPMPRLFGLTLVGGTHAFLCIILLN